MSSSTLYFLPSAAATMVWLVNMADGDRCKRNSSEPHQQELPAAGRQSGQGLLECPHPWFRSHSHPWLCFGLQLSPARAHPVRPRKTEASRPAGSTSSSTSWGHCSPPRRAGGRSRSCQALGRHLVMMTTRRVSVEMKNAESGFVISAEK